MISRLVRYQLIAFVVISVLGIGYVAITYVGLNVFKHPYHISVHMPRTGGLYQKAAVTYRGVDVGRVKSIRVVPGGVDADVAIQQDYDHIPADTKAVVGNLSAVGEQFLDLQPQSDHGPYLHGGSIIGRHQVTLPVPTQNLLRNVERLAGSVNDHQLATVIDSLGKGFRHTGPNLQKIIDNGNKLTNAATDALPPTVALINSGKTVLDTQVAVAQEFRTFAQQINSFSAQLVKSDPDLRSTLDNGVLAAKQLDALLKENKHKIPVLLDNLTTLSQIQSTRLVNLRAILSLYPAIIANGFNTAVPVRCKTDQIAAHSCDPSKATLRNPLIARFGLVINLVDNLCHNGYTPKSKRRTNHPSDWGGKAPLDVHCLEPHDSQKTVRGARNAPRPPDDDTAGPQGPVTYAEGSSSSPTRAALTYNPLSRVFTLPSGQRYTMGTAGGESRSLGGDSWQWPLLAPLFGGAR
jgi:phospholipid/cholesterol/gamma-HCH transport system substrate-binding protein